MTANDKYKRAIPQTGIMTITPEIAQEMLSTSCGNRPLRKRHVTLLAQAMKRGEWRVTSQGIGFDVFGRLRDAHHRLHACIEAGVEFRSIVALGMPVDAYEVTDTGLSRSVGDRMDMDRRIAEILRLGASIAIGTPKPTIAQIRPFAEAGLFETAKYLIDYCGTSRKYYASVPLKLTACIALLNATKDSEVKYVVEQYRALVLLDFDHMSSCSRSLVRQEQNGLAHSQDRGESLARGVKVFDITKSQITRISINKDDVEESYLHIKATLNALAGTSSIGKIGR